MHFITMKTQLLYSGKLHLRYKFFYKQRFVNISLHIIKIWGLPPYHCFIKFLTTAIGIYLRIHILEIFIWKTWKFHQLLVIKRCSSINIMRTSKKPSNNFWGNVKLHEKLGPSISCSIRLWWQNGLKGIHSLLDQFKTNFPLIKMHSIGLHSRWIYWFQYK